MNKLIAIMFTASLALLSVTNASQVSANEIEDVCASWESTFPENAYTVTEEDRLSLQELLDTHNVLRLTPGDYRTDGLDKIILDSNQSIIALSPTLFPNVEIVATLASRIYAMLRLS